MSLYDEEIEQPIQEQDIVQDDQTSEQKSATDGEQVEGGDQEHPTSTPETVVTLLGREYDLSKPDQVQELAKDYDRLGRQYAPLMQRIQELEKQIASFQHSTQNTNSTPDVNDPEVVEYLRKLGFVHQTELQSREEQERLENYLVSLENEYDGSDGRPKFDRQEVLQYCVQNGIADPLAGYKLLHEKELTEWMLKNTSKVAPPPSNKGVSGTINIKPKKVTLGFPENENEIDLRTAMERTLEEETPRMSE